MALVDSVLVFVVSLLVGATGIYAGARVATGMDSFGRAVVTALVGSLVWSVVGASSAGFRSSDRCWPSSRTSA